MLVEALILVCLVGAAVVAAAPDRLAGRLALAVSALPVGGSLYMYAAFDGSGNALLGGDIAYETFFRWLSLGPYAVQAHVVIDGVRAQRQPPEERLVGDVAAEQGVAAAVESGVHVQ